MDRLFLYETEYCEDIHNEDGVLTIHALKEFYKQNLDICGKISLSEITRPGYMDRLFADAFRNGLRIVPVGSIEFVTEFLKYECGVYLNLKPLEIPKAVRPYVKRLYVIKKGKDLNWFDLNPDISFVKDIDVPKRFHSLLCTTSEQVRSHILPEANYAVSENIGQFSSEWRVFVYQDKVLGIECYQGDPLALPNGQVIHKIVRAYMLDKARPKAYTLDVGVRNIVTSLAGDKTEETHEITDVIELHPFVAVGLYGFYHTKLPDMWEQGYLWYKQRK